MKFDKIPAHEASFKESGTAIQGVKYNLKPFSIQVPDEPLMVDITSCRPASGDKTYYYDEAQPKNKVIVHFTAGYIKSDIFYLAKPGRKISVAFVIARDGTIYNIFHSSKWSYHLGRGAVGGNGTNSKSSIGIEMSNIGPLKRIGDNLVTSYADTDVYCSINDKDQYVELEQEFRGYKYFAAHTDEQYRSLALLLRYLTKKYDIPRAFLPEDKRYDATPEAAAFEGIVTHVNFRTSGKWDLGPGFDWDRLISDVTGNGDSLAPKVMSRAAVKTHTEEEIESKVVILTRGVEPEAVYYGEDGPDEVENPSPGAMD